MSTDVTLPTTDASPPLPNDLGVCQQMIRELLDTLQTEQRVNEQLRQRIDQLLRRLFGPRAERYDPSQPLLFPDLQAAPAAAEGEPAPHQTEAAPASSNGKRGHGRRPFPANLPRHRVVHDVPEAQRLCPDCGAQCTCIGEDIRSQLEYIPASVVVLDHVWPKLVCRRCEKHVVLSEPPASPIAKGLPGPGLLAQVAVSKYDDHLPLYRLERIFGRQGVELRRTTMCGWMAAAAGLLRPVYDLMVQHVLASAVIHTDDTTVAVQDPERDRTKTGRFWGYLGDRHHPYNVFDYTPTRERIWPAAFLGDFEGYLQADAFSGYDRLYLKRPIVEVGCHAHARRKFYEAKETDGSRAHQALAFYRQLYEVERQAQEKAQEQFGQRSAEAGVCLQDLLKAQRLQLRQEKSVPILTSMCQWLKQQQAEVLPKSPIGQAISYALNHWEALQRYTTQGFLAIDNNVAEREMKRIAIGRKNWLFCGSDEGGQTAAVLFSFMSTCQRHEVNPFEYLRDVFRRLPKHPADSLEELLPDRWAKLCREASQSAAAATGCTETAVPTPDTS